MITTGSIEELCKKLKPVLGDDADKLWYLYLSEDEKGRKILATEIEILSEKLLKKDPLTETEILLSPPAKEDSEGDFYIGDVVYNSKKLHPLFLRYQDLVKQVGIFAITGEGKTNLAYLLALQLLKEKIPFMVIDWKRSWRSLLSLKGSFPELKDVQVFTIGRDALPFLWNPFRAPPGSDKGLWIGSISEALEKSHLSGPGVAYYFNKIYSNRFSSSSDNFFPNFYDGIHELQNMKASERELRWKQTALRILQSFTMGKVAKVFNSRNPIKLEEILNKPVILELDLEIPKPLRVFLSEIILRWIHLYRLSQGETDKLRHVLFLEEVHNLFNTTVFNKEPNSIENVYREVRGFGQGLVSITQHPSMLPVFLLGNCHTQIYLGLQHEDDIKTARKSLFLKYGEEPYLNMLNVGECIVKIKNRVEPCLVKTPLVPVGKGGLTDDWLKVNTQSYFPRADNGINQKKPGDFPAYNIEKENGKHPDNKNSPQHRLLADILENPLCSTISRYKRLKLNPKYGNKYKNLLISQGCIQPRKIITIKGWITLYDLVQKGKMILRDLGFEFKNTSEGIVHQFWKDRIARFYINHGLKVRVEEYCINGRPDIIVEKDDKKIAIEIETGKSDFINNIKRALEAGFDEIICVATNKIVEDKIQHELQKHGINDKKVRVTNVLAF